MYYSALIIFAGLGLVMAYIGYAIRFRGKVYWLAANGARQISAPIILAKAMGNLLLLMGILCVTCGLLTLTHLWAGVIAYALSAAVVLWQMFSVSRRYTKR